MAIKQDNMVEFAKCMQAGYFYTFTYDAKNKKDTDAKPVIYCAYAPLTSNNFTGINFHYFPDNIKILIIKNMNKAQNILSDDIIHIFNGQQLNSCFTNIGYAMREYNKTRVRNCYRIKNKYIPYFLNIPSKFFMSNDLENSINLALELGTNKGF